MRYYGCRKCGDVRIKMSQGSSAVASPRVINIEDLRRIAKRRLPRAVFDYLDGGAEAEVTLRENCQIFDHLTFRPRQAVSFPEYDLSTTVLGAQISFPAMLAPVGYSRLMHPGGEVAAAAAAYAAGTGSILSTSSGAYKRARVVSGVFGRRTCRCGRSD